jgi:uncharacterized protein YaaQ
MKLIMAIVQAVDARVLMDGLMAEGYRATKIGSTGGFLVRGNVTVLVGVEDDKVDGVLAILSKYCHGRREFVSPVVPISDSATARGWSQPHQGGTGYRPAQVEVGGTTVFVLDVARFERI